MKALTDKAIQFRTFPVMPRKRVKYDETTPVEFSEFGSGNVLFKCMGGYLTHHSYRLFDYFTSHWFEIACGKWIEIYGGSYPKALIGNVPKKLAELTPLLKWNSKSIECLGTDLIDLYRSMQDYAVIDSLSDREMRKHPSLKGFSSSGLFEAIDRTSRTKLKLNYPIRTLKYKGKTMIGWEDWSNLSDAAPWSKLFDYRLVEEKAASDGRIVDRIYKFGFNSQLGIAMIHNAICAGTWSVNPKLYQVSADAQLLYRYLVIAGGRRKNNTVEYIGHRIGWREKQTKRLGVRIQELFAELREAELITDYEVSSNCRHPYLFSFEYGKKRHSTKKHDNKDGDRA